MALAVDAAVPVHDALVLVLALVPVGELVAPAAAAVGLAVAGADVEEGLLLGQDVHVSAGPELVAAAPLAGLPHQPDGAVDTLEVRGQSHLVVLSPAIKILLNRYNFLQNRYQLLELRKFVNFFHYHNQLQFAMQYYTGRSETAKYSRSC